MIRYGTSKYSSRADAVSLQDVRMRNYMYIVMNCTYDQYTCVPAYLPIHASAEKSHELWPSGQTKKR